MEILQTVLPILVDILLVVFLVICIILGIKAIKAMDKFNALVDDAQKKLDTLNGFFSIITLFNTKVSLIAEKTYSLFDNLIDKLFKTKKKKRKKVRDEEDELDDILKEEEED